MNGVGNAKVIKMEQPSVSGSGVVGRLPRDPRYSSPAGISCNTCQPVSSCPTGSRIVQELELEGNGTPFMNPLMPRALIVRDRSSDWEEALELVMSKVTLMVGGESLLSVLLATGNLKGCTSVKFYSVSKTDIHPLL
ncbi:hypothetical protein J6590_075074 [Homalodisca vitripennis]|nr:hypothetical protein J6590_075074 [Homalodisca vitripennis]